MQYKKVKRYVTIELDLIPGTQEYTIRLTPDPVVARFGDTIIWDVQGLTAAQAALVKIVSFLPISVPPPLLFIKNKLVPAATTPIPKSKVPVKPRGSRFQAELDLDQADPGTYKYEVEYDGHIVLDPDIEIRGPK